MTRLRLMRDIDLSKADPTCRRCHGRGVVGMKHATPAEKAAGVPDKIPLVCRCVFNRGGVAQDSFDQELSQSVEEGFSSGGFARKMAERIMLMPQRERDAALVKLRERSKNSSLDPQVAAALARTADEMASLMASGREGHPIRDLNHEPTG